MTRMDAEFWERAADVDPMWAVLSDPARRGRRWSASEFFATGRREVSLLMFQLSRLGHAPRLGAALDFGCGLGRVSQALGAHFEQVVGIDVSPRMVRLASFLNQHGPRVTYLVNDRPDLTCLEEHRFDLIYSDIVLQHIPPEASRAYIREFVRVLGPGGIAVFQLPAQWRPPQTRPTFAVPMSHAAYRASITPSCPFLERVEPNMALTATVEVTNTSSIDWDQQTSGVMRLGNHWLRPDGTMLIQDDGRSDLPVRVPAGGRATLTLPVTAPAEPGQYLCEFDLVHEAVSWFGDRGSNTTRLAVSVGGSAAADAAAAPPPAADAADLHYPELDSLLPPLEAQPDLGEFPMHGIPADEVLELLQSAGARCFYQEPDDRGGPEWEGYRYFVRRE